MGNKILNSKKNLIAEEYIKQGKELYQSNLKEDSLIMFNKAIELSPSNINAYINKAYSLYSLKRLKETKEVIDQAINIDPKNEFLMKLKLLLSISENK